MGCTDGVKGGEKGKYFNSNFDWQGGPGMRENPRGSCTRQAGSESRGGATRHASTCIPGM